MAKLPSLDHVKFVKRGAKVYAYFNTGQKKDGKAIYTRLPDPASPEFYTQYGNLKSRRDSRPVKSYTVADLTDEYLKSKEFASKAAGTQKLYRIQAKKIYEAWGKYPVNELTPHWVRFVLDGADWGPGTRNTVVSTLGAVYTWGRKRNKASVEPCKDIDRADIGEHQPWPEDVLEAALASDDATVRLAVHLLYFTGQRISDVLAMRWGDIRGDVLTVTPGKTKRFKKTLYIPLLTGLRAELEATPKTGLTILTGFNDYQLRELLQAFTRALGVETVPHGLRKNAVNSLLEAGCTIAEVAAITGQSFAMVEHYAARVNTKQLGSAAMLKFERKRRNAP